jgi:hypothetical protein
MNSSLIDEIFQLRGSESSDLLSELCQAYSQSVGNSIALMVELFYLECIVGGPVKQ